LRIFQIENQGDRKVGGNFENILQKQQNLSLGIYNPIDWHKREFVVSQIKVGITTLPGPCSPVFCDW
jgi:hypothetical protein